MKTNEADIDSELKCNDRRNTAGGYSWWKWRRSTDSQEKKPTPKDADDADDRDDKDDKDRSTVVCETETKEATDQPTMAAADGVETTVPEAAATEPTTPMDYQLRSIGAAPFDETPLDGSKHDDSITAELDLMNKKGGGAVEKYRKTLRLTSEQIVSTACSETDQLTA